MILHNAHKHVVCQAMFVHTACTSIIIKVVCFIGLDGLE